MDINDTFIACADKWAKHELDDRINFALDNFDEWISNYDKEEKELLVKLLQDFDYYSYSNIVAIMAELNLKIVKEYGISSEDTKINNSANMLQQVLNNNDALDAFKIFKFEKMALESLSGKLENFIEVINQPHIYLISIIAVEYLYNLYPVQSFIINLIFIFKSHMSLCGGI